jgi:hypothetical protein
MGSTRDAPVCILHACRNDNMPIDVTKHTILLIEGL